MTTNPKNVLENYKKVEKEKEDKIKKVVEEYSSQSETEEEESKHYCKFAEQGGEAVKTMTGFTTAEFLELYGVVEKSLKVTGRGKRPEIGPLIFQDSILILFFLSWLCCCIFHHFSKSFYS